MAIKIFYHISPSNHALEVVKEHIMAFHYSGLYTKADQILCFLSGGNDGATAKAIAEFLLTAGKKIKIVACDIEDTSYERFTLLRMHDFLENSDIALYMHSKGVTHTSEPKRERTEDWTRILAYHLIRYHERCIGLLQQGYDIVGPGHSPADCNPEHFSGNMWWVRGDYYKRLPRSIGPRYYDPEFYVCQIRPKTYCIFKTGINHYMCTYKMDNYVDMVLE